MSHRKAGVHDRVTCAVPVCTNDILYVSVGGRRRSRDRRRYADARNAFYERPSSVIHDNIPRETRYQSSGLINNKSCIWLIDYPVTA
ncbi:hypothetical protein BN903_11 [Halorubrum sp. AJ67]|nr:hypothetical protein BN903_11 [Halorubrum sp. AJ67]